MSDEKMGFAAEVVEHAGHFDGDVASAYEGDALGEFLEIEEAIRVYAELGAGYGHLLRVAACGEKDLLCADGLFAAVVEDDFNFVLGEEMCAAVYIFNIVVLEILFIDAVQSFDVGITLVLECGKIERCSLFDVEAV